MYDLHLTHSLIPEQTDDDVLETTVGGLLRDTAGAHAGATAITEVTIDGETGRSWTYAQFLADSERLALALSTRFKPGERVCVWSPNTPEWLLMEFACALSGLVLVTANPAYQAKELRYVLEQSGAVGLYSVESYRGNPMAEIAREALAGVVAVRVVADMDDHSQLFARGDLPEGLPEVSPGDAVQIQYTSGTTGFPKGAVLHHRGVTNNARFYAKRAKVPDGATWSSYMPMFHTAGCGMTTLGCLQTAGRHLIFKIFDPISVLRQTELQRAEMILGVPTMHVAMIEALAQQSFDVSSVQMAISGGSMVAPELVRNVRETFGCEFETVYGQTETSPLITQHHATDTLDDICNTIGQPMPQTAVSIRGVEDGSVMPIGEVGEICVRGYLTMLGYHANEKATSETIDADGWLHTGDLGTMDARGYLRITGRVKEMIIRGGENLFPAEIENVLLEHPSIAEVAVVGLPDEKWGEIVACFARPEPGQAIEPGELRAHCREHISPQKTPAIWCRVDGFPLTGSGKIQKFALRDGYLEGLHEAL
ncbi:MAG: AMP-binding protein [Pseudomonadota bacterium]